ncbi:hypothetical protein [Shewanella baltica]|uniref:hypothetical protein n=1 Tax=Shewanella baltica TaxID=62322 RepID=UPI00217F02DD|nr:hypothetical protein [Shewanella baltica]MCS6177718.1 hypothetical protein [Shewanella baltica]MCS6253864.1 hypothetical protein [Shewanella baltica]
MGELFNTLLLIVACAPILYWLGKITTAFVIYKFSLPHFVVMEYQNNEGKIVHSEKVDVSKDKTFYKSVLKAYREGQRKESEAL